jgi:hypothetical protein|tara:strand:- start:709 stop:993 length:285 start_codon:yes stop_codon:yes gene_type:complete
MPHKIGKSRACKQRNMSFWRTLPQTFKGIKSLNNITKRAMLYHQNLFSHFGLSVVEVPYILVKTAIKSVACLFTQPCGALIVGKNQEPEEEFIT